MPGISRLVEFIIAKERGCNILKRDLKRAYRRVFGVSSCIAISKLVHNGGHLYNFSIHLKVCDLEECTL